MSYIKTYGRKVPYANYTEYELLNAEEKKQKNIIIDILDNSINIHEINKNETLYLKDYYKGIQDILSKVKHTRAEINNKVVENWALANIDFKVSFLLGKAIQYVKANDKTNNEVSILNNFCKYENKKAKDTLLYKNVLVSGRAFRFIQPDKINEEDEAPFEIINCDVDKTEVVYSSRVGHEQLLSFIEVDMIDRSDPNNYVEYKVYEVFLRNKKYVVSKKEDGYTFLIQNVLGTDSLFIPLINNEHLITEYYVNEERISLIEIGKDLFDSINNTESLDLDDIEQFVNAIMVFTNAKVDEEAMGEIKSMGAVSINSTEQKKASVNLLQSRLSANQTQEFYNRLLSSLHQILGIPMANAGGGQEYGDTGKAKLTGQGFVSAGIRIENDENMFSMCDINSLKVILKICKQNSSSNIKNLKVSDIDCKFQRDNSENLLIKTQALTNLYSCDIPRQFANQVIGLFGDSNAVTEMQEELFGNQISKQDSSNENQIIGSNEQNNNISSIIEQDEQGN